MEYIKLFIDMFLHLDVYLPTIIDAVGGWTYALLFGVIFMETGFVVTPFLPGDSLLFAAGAVASKTSSIDLAFLYPLMAFAAIIGDTVNYSIGHFIGPRAFSGKVRWLKQDYLERTQKFYAKHGGKTIILARFVPIIRTYAPFMAGVGGMRYTYFVTYNIIGGMLWTAMFLFGGYFFGNLKFIADRFSLVILAIVVISFIPPVIEYFKARKEAAQTEKEKHIADLKLEEPTSEQ
jgi:membrane-associated protein